jgi:hypothetical protein
MPIWAIDLDGLEPVFVHGTWSEPDTWKTEFMIQMAEATGWGSDVPLYLQNGVAIIRQVLDWMQRVNYMTF